MEITNFRVKKKEIRGGDYTNFSFLLGKDLIVHDGVFGEFTFKSTKRTMINGGSFNDFSFSNSKDICVKGGFFNDYALTSSQDIKLIGGEFGNNTFSYASSVFAYLKGPIKSISNAYNSFIVIKDLGELIIEENFLKTLNAEGTKFSLSIYCVNLEKPSPYVHIISKELFDKYYSTDIETLDERISSLACEHHMSEKKAL